MELCMVQNALSWGFAGNLAHQHVAVHQTEPEELDMHVAGALEFAFPGMCPAGTRTRAEWSMHSAVCTSVSVHNNYYHYRPPGRGTVWLGMGFGGEFLLYRL